MASRGVIDLRIILTNKKLADVTSIFNSYTGQPMEFFSWLGKQCARTTVTGNGMVAKARGVTFTNNVPTTQSVTITIGTNPLANDTLRFGNTVITFVASAANENQVTIGADVNGSAAALKAALAAHSLLGGLFVATVATNVVTLTVSYPEVLMSQLYMLSSTGSVVVSGQFTTSGLSFQASNATPIAGGTF